MQKHHHVVVYGEQDPRDAGRDVRADLPQPRLELRISGIPSGQPYWAVLMSEPTARRSSRAN